MKNLPEIIGWILVAAAALFASWALLALMAWTIISPENNISLCQAKAKAIASDSWTTTGWRNDTCYIYKGGKEMVVKL